MNRLWLIGLMALSTTLAAGCYEEEDSCNIRTPGVFVEYTLVESNGAATARATFWTGDDAGGTYLKLGDSCGDTIEVNGEAMELIGSNPEYYKVELDIAERYEFAFIRPDDEETYVSEISDLPPEVQIEEPSGQSYARDEDIPVVWDENGTGDIFMELEGDCIDDITREWRDDASAILDSNQVDDMVGDENESCEVEMKMYRQSEGDLNENLRGTFDGKTLDTTTFRSTPSGG